MKGFHLSLSANLQKAKLFFRIFSVLCFVVFMPLFTLEDSFAGMKGPKATHRHSHEHEELEAEPIISASRIAFDWAINLFQKRISPIDGPRCGFHPTCSQFGKEAIQEHGSLGIAMTGDRLIRCNQWKRPGYDYPLMPNGRLYDPVERNRLTENQGR